MTDTTTAPKAPAKKAIPSQTFEGELAAGSSKVAAKEAGAKAGELLMVPVDHIDLIDGFNVRIETPDYAAHIESLAASIVANGFYPNKPLAVYVAKEDGKNRFKLTDGYSRMRAVIRARELGAEIETLPVVVKAQTQTIEDLTVALVQDNEGRPLNPFERAIVVKRLEGFGWDNATIAGKLGVTERYVSDLKVLAGAPASVRNLVVKGEVSPTEAVKQLRKNSETAGEVLKGAVAEAKAKGKAKATGKDVKKAAGGEGSKTPAAKKGIDMSKVERDGKLHTTITYNLKAGEIYPTDEIKPVWLFNDASFWNYVDDETRKDVVIEEDTLIVVSIVNAVPAEDEQNEQEADETLTPAIGDQTEGGEGDDGPSVDHAAGDADDTAGL